MLQAYHLHSVYHTLHTQDRVRSYANQHHRNDYILIYRDLDGAGRYWAHKSPDPYDSEKTRALALIDTKIEVRAVSYDAALAAAINEFRPDPRIEEIRSLVESCEYGLGQIESRIDSNPDDCDLDDILNNLQKADSLCNLL